MHSHGWPFLINCQSIQVWLIKEPIRFKQIKGHHQCQPLIKLNAEFHAYKTLMHQVPLRVEILTPLVTPDHYRVRVKRKFHIYGLTFGFSFYFFNLSKNSWTCTAILAKSLDKIYSLFLRLFFLSVDFKHGKSAWWEIKIYSIR